MGKDREEPKKKKKSAGRIIFRIILFLFLLCVISGGVLLGIVIYKAPALDIVDARPDGYRTNVLDDQENVVLTLSGQESNRVYVKLEEVPENLQHAFVAIEDNRFYDHHGIDIRGIARAVYQGIKNKGMTEGASTITQQLLKNNVFTGWMQEDTFLDKVERKLQEQYLAIVLETKVDKSWIMENYLNTINLGGGNWGVETASRYYFDKDVTDLTLSECAVLAGITKNPTSYNPLTNPEKNSVRREKVLRNMQQLGYISEEQCDEALADPVYDRIAEAHGTSTGAQVFDYFQDELVYQVLNDLMANLQISEDAAWNMIYRGGLTIYSTENKNLQTIAEEEVNKEEYGGNGAQVSLVLMDQKTGAVKALIGGRGTKDASLIYDRAVSSVRQPGSAIKILGEYAAGLETGAITLGTVFDDAPYAYSNGDSIVNSDGNYDGRITVDQAIACSDNVVALKCFQQVGVDRVYAGLQSFGITTLNDQDKVEALALGGTANGVTNLELSAAYASIANGGQYLSPVYYTKVLDHEGNEILNASQNSYRSVSESTARLLTTAMEAVMTAGTGRAADFDGMSLAGKSGTTNNVRDAWFVGFSPYYTCGIWGGFDDNTSQESNEYVKTIWKAVMSRANEGLEDAGLMDASGMVGVRICTKCGKRAVDGLCDSTLQGDMTAMEYFMEGTEPTESCDCHKKVTVCRQTGLKARSYCPNDQREDRVYLLEGSAGTADEAYVLPKDFDKNLCTEHTHFWDSWTFGDSSEEEPAEPISPNWWDDLWDSDNGGAPSENDPGAASPEVPPEENEGDNTPGGGTSWWDRLFGT